jgi:hypothetical protein
MTIAHASSYWLPTRGLLFISDSPRKSQLTGIGIITLACAVFIGREFKCRSTDRQAHQGVWLPAFGVLLSCLRVMSTLRIYYSRQGHHVMWCLWTYLVAKATIYQSDAFVSPHWLRTWRLSSRGKLRAAQHMYANGDAQKYPSVFINQLYLEKLTVPRLVKTFARVIWKPKCITAFTSASHLSLSWARAIQSTPTPTTSSRSVLILPSHLCVSSKWSRSGLKTLHTSLPHACHMPRPSLSSYTPPPPNNVSWQVQTTSRITPFPAVPFKSRLWGTDVCRCPILKSRQPFLPQCERPSFTPTRNIIVCDSPTVVKTGVKKKTTIPRNATHIGYRN